ncbi:MAG TPA: GAF domain-containing protein [Actinomycetota bacterium]|nr:GAF domain-containing protein [Actinomycetota bacterium]
MSQVTDLSEPGSWLRTPPAEAARVLREMLRDRRDDTEALFEMITSLVSMLDLAKLLRYVLSLCRELTGCEGVLLYLWDRDRERLVVRAALDGYEQWIGRFSLAIGEGLTGWTALTRQPGIIREDPNDDPRFKFVPEMQDDRFQSYLTIPVEGSESQLVGVVTMHTLAPHEFTDDDLTLMHTLSALIGAAVENATLYERQARHVEVLHSLAETSQAVVQASSLRHLLHRLASTSGGLVGADRCAVLTLDDTGGHLTLETLWSTDPSGVMPPAVPAEGPWARLLGATTPVSIDRRDGHDAFEIFEAIAPHARTALAAPMRVSDRVVGLFVFFKDDGHAFGKEDLELLATITSQAALAVENARLIEVLTERNVVRDLFEALALGEGGDIGLEARASRLGIDLDQPHVVTVFEVSAHPAVFDADRVWISLRQDLGSRFPGSVFSHRDHTLTGLLRLSDATSLDHLAERISAAKSTHQRPPELVISAGVSRVCVRVLDYPDGFEQARQALLMGRAVRGVGAAVTFDELGAQWHLLRAAQQQVRDVYQVRLEKLLEQDRQKGTQLFRTVEVYLESLGNSKLAADRLFVHRNTLRQRFEKIRQAVGIDLSERDRWFDLMIAVRIIRLRELSR